MLKTVLLVLGIIALLPLAAAALIVLINIGIIFSWIVIPVLIGAGIVLAILKLRG